MSGILKVDQIQLRDGSTPSAADLGLNVTNAPIQVITSKDNTAYTQAGTTRNYPIDAYITTSGDSKITINVTCPIYTGATSGAWATMAFQGIDIQIDGAWTALHDFEHDAINYNEAFARTMGGVMVTDVLPAGTYGFRYWFQNYNSSQVAYVNRDNRSTTMVITEVAQ